jgi:hypothetical protein
MLVRERERVRTRRGEYRIAALLVLLDHLPPAARVAGDRRRRHRMRRRQQARIDERPYEQDERGRVTAGIGDARRRADARALIGRKLRQPEHPVRRRPVRGARVDETRLRIRDERRRLAGGRVGQTQKRDVGRVQQPRAFSRVLAFVRVDAEDLDVVAPREHVANAQPRGAFLPIDERHPPRH